jgi:hypothetical protein
LANKDVDGRNNRQLARNNFIHNFSVIEQQTGVEIGDLADITIKGVMLICDRAIETDRDYMLELAPDGKITKGTKIDFSARAIRCTEIEIQDIFSVGFIINKIDKISKDSLNALIEEYGLDCIQL